MAVCPGMAAMTIMLNYLTELAQLCSVTLSPYLFISRVSNTLIATAMIINGTLLIVIVLL